MCRSQTELEQSVREKLSTFCYMSPDRVISVADVRCLYRVPVLLDEQGVTEFILRHFNLHSRFFSRCIRKLRDSLPNGPATPAPPPALSNGSPTVKLAIHQKPLAVHMTPLSPKSNGPEGPLRNGDSSAEKALSPALHALHLTTNGASQGLAPDALRPCASSPNLAPIARGAKPPPVSLSSEEPLASARKGPFWSPSGSLSLRKNSNPIMSYWKRLVDRYALSRNRRVC